MTTQQFPVVRPSQNIRTMADNLGRITDDIAATEERNARLTARVHDLEKSLRFYAEEAHRASSDAMHSFHFLECNHPDCIKARNMLVKATP